MLLATALTDNTSELFRDMWYNYHRKGLDEMAANPDRGRTTIIGLLPVLEQVKSARPTSPLLQMFADSKLDEVVLIYSKALHRKSRKVIKCCPICILLSRRVWNRLKSNLE